MLAGGGPADVVELTLALAREMLAGAGVTDVDPAEALADGSAMDAWKRDDPGPGRRPGRAAARWRRSRTTCWRPASGVLTRLDALAVGIAAWRLGAGRARKEDPVQAGAGVRWHARPGDAVTEGQPLMTLLTDEPDRFERALAASTGVLSTSPSDAVSTTPDPIVMDRVGSMTQLSAGETFDSVADAGPDGDRLGQGRRRRLRPDRPARGGPRRHCAAVHRQPAVRPGVLQQPHDPRRVGDPPGRQPDGSGEGDDESVAGRPRPGARPGGHDPVPGQQLPGSLARWVANAYCRLVDDETDEELARFTLTFSLEETGAVLALLRRTPSGWTLHAVGEGVAITVPTRGAGEADPLRQLSLTRAAARPSRPRRPAWTRPRSR